MAAMKCVTRKVAVVILLIAIFLFLISVIVLACFPALYNLLLHKELSLVNNSMAFKMWRDLPIPIYEEIYYFNITNKKEFLANKEKLNVVQLGPYVFKADWKKHNIQWHPNKTVTYQELRTYEFCPDRSSGSLEDEIFTFNGPVLVAADVIKNAPFWVKAGASLIFIAINEELIIKRSIREVTYEGYDDLIIKVGRYVMKDIPFKEGKFAWLYGKNATYDGQFTVFTGEDDIKKLNIINTWNGEEKLTFWKDDTCNMMNGSSVELNPPLDEGQTEFNFFQSFFCRTLTFNYNNTDVVHSGIPTKRFYATDKLLANGTVNPDNFCFDTDPNLRSGLLDVGPCQFNAPAFLSFPHFFLADSYYEQAVTGLNSSGADYSSYVDIEPTSGLTVNAKLNFQLNLRISQGEVWPLTGVQEGFFPVLWVNLQVSLPDDLADTVRSMLIESKTIVYSVLGVVIGIAVVLIIVSIIILIKAKRSHQRCEKDEVDPILTSTQGPSVPNREAPSAPSRNISQEESKPTGFKSVETVEKEERLLKQQSEKPLKISPSINADDESIIDD